VDTGWRGRVAGQHGDVAMKQFKSYRPTPPPRRANTESATGSIIRFMVGIGLFLALLLIILGVSL